ELFASLDFEAEHLNPESTGGFIELAEINGGVGIIDVDQSGQSTQTGDDLLEDFKPFTDGVGRPCWTKLAKAASILRSLPTDKIRGSMPDACAAVCTSLIWDSEVGFPGLMRKPITLALGTSSRIIPNRFAPSVLTINVTPVTLPPGRLRLETRPRSI